MRCSWWDTLPALDRGWIDPAGWLLLVLTGKRGVGKSSFVDAVCAAGAAHGIRVERLSFSAALKDACAELASAIP